MFQSLIALGKNEYLYPFVRTLGNLKVTESVDLVLYMLVAMLLKWCIWEVCHTSTTSCSHTPATAASLAVSKSHPHLKLLFNSSPTLIQAHPSAVDPPRDLASPHHPCPTYPSSSQWQTPTSFGARQIL